MGAAETRGVAACQGDKEKTARYGQAVWPCIMEARGRLSEGGRAAPQRLVLDSQTYGRRVPGAESQDARQGCALRRSAPLSKLLSFAP